MYSYFLRVFTYFLPSPPPPKPPPDFSRTALYYTIYYTIHVLYAICTILYYTTLYYISHKGFGNSPAACFGNSPAACFGNFPKGTLANSPEELWQFPQRNFGNFAQWPTIYRAQWPTTWARPRKKLGSPGRKKQQNRMMPRRILMRSAEKARGDCKRIERRERERERRATERPPEGRAKVKESTQGRSYPGTYILHT